MMNNILYEKRIEAKEMTTIYVRLHCASCNRVLGWRESREDTRWIRALCDDCYDDEKDKTDRTEMAKP